MRGKLSLRNGLLIGITLIALLLLLQVVVIAEGSSSGESGAAYEALVLDEAKYAGFDDPGDSTQATTSGVAVIDPDAQTVVTTVTTFLPLAARPHELLYSDDFSDPGSGWYVGDVGTVRWSYQGGEYEMLLRNPEWWSGIVGPVEIYAPSNYRLLTTVRQATAVGAVHGVIYDWQDWENFKVLAVSPAHSVVGLFGLAGGNPVVYQDWIQHPAAAVGIEWHAVQLERLSTRTVVWINGVEVIDLASSGTARPMRVGYYLATGAQTPALLRADDIYVYGLPDNYNGVTGAPNETIGSAPVAPATAIYSEGGIFHEWSALTED